MSISKSFLWFTVLLYMLTACQPGVSVPVRDTRPISISFTTTDLEKKIYEDLARTFEAEHPSIHVEIRSRDKLMAELLAIDSQPSVFSQDRWMLAHSDTLYAGDLRDLMLNKLILDLRPLMDIDATFQKDDFYPHTIERYQTDTGEVWALPRSQYVNLLTYNKDLFTQSGVPIPEWGWSWIDVLETAEQLSRKKGDTVEIYGLLKSFATLPLITDYFRNIGKDLGVTPPNEVRFDDPGLEPVIARIQAMRDNGVLLLTRDNDPDNAQLLDMGSPLLAELRYTSRIAMWDDAYFATSQKSDSTSSESLPFDVGYAPYPVDQYTFGASGQAYIISAGTANPFAAWQWIEFLSRQPGVVETAFELTSTNRSIPARISTAEKSAFWEHTDPKIKEAMLWALAHAPTEADYPHELVALGMLLTLDEIVFDHPEMTPRQVLTKVQERFVSTLADQVTRPTSAVEPITIVATSVPTIDPSGRTVIQYYDFGQSYFDIDQLVTTFNKSQQRVLVTVISAVPTQSAQVFEQVAAASDCFLWTGTLPTNAAQFVADLTPYANTDPSFSRDDYFPALLKSTMPNGHLLGLPYTLQMRALHYQAQRFSEANIPAPNGAWSLDDMLNAARGLTNGVGTTRVYGYAPIAGFEPDLLFVIEQFGGKLFVDRGGVQEPTLSDPKVLAAINWYFDLARIHHVMPPLDIVFRHDFDITQSAHIVRSGHAVMWFGESTLMVDPSMTNDSTFREAMAPLPIKAAGLSASSMYMQSLYISANSHSPEACWEWIQFLQHNTTVSNRPGILPTRRIAASQVPFAATEVDKMLFDAHSTMLKQEERLVSAGDSISSPQLRWFFLAVRKAAGGADLQHELETAQMLTMAYQTCINEQKDIQSCLKEVQALE